MQSSASRDDHGVGALLPLVYEELRQLARTKMAWETPGHTLQPTALVHEAWMRMVGDQERDWRNRAYFFSAASTAMRRILVEHARAKSRLKRGGENLRQVDLEALDQVVTAPDEKILRVDEALGALEKSHSEWARVVEMKYFGGMSHAEIAASLNLSERSVVRHWACARAWLYRWIQAHP